MPISSSGHLELTRWAFGWDDLNPEIETAFDVAVHLGTLIGALGYLRDDVIRYVKAGLSPLGGRPIDTDGRIGWALVLSVAPAGLVGVLFKGQIDYLDSIPMIAVMLIVFGGVLFVADRFEGSRGVTDFGWRTALAVGAAQAVALQPGVSRSGVTLTMSRALGFEREAAARLVFLMSLPVIAGAGLFALADVTIPSSFRAPFVWGTVASAITGWMAVWATLRLVRSYTFTPFVVYRVLLGVVVLMIMLFD